MSITERSELGKVEGWSHGSQLSRVSVMDSAKVGVRRNALQRNQ